MIKPNWGRRLVWSRLVASGAIDPGSNPGGPTKSILFPCELTLFCLDIAEYPEIKCFKCFRDYVLF
jgi:hypothetical protein